MKTLNIITLAIVIAAAVYYSATPADSGTSTSAAGRYQIIFNTEARMDTWLIDTYTGKMWTPTRFIDVAGRPRVWEPEIVFNNKKEVDNWLKKQVFIDPNSCLRDSECDIGYKCVKEKCRKIDSDLNPY